MTKPTSPKTKRSRGRVAHLFTSNRGLLEAQVRALRNIPTLKRSLAISTDEGYGRLDAFGIGRDELFGAIGDQQPPGRCAGQHPSHLGHGVHGLAAVGRQHELGDGAQHRTGARRRRALRCQDLREHRAHRQPPSAGDAGLQDPAAEVARHVPRDRYRTRRPRARALLPELRRLPRDVQDRRPRPHLPALLARRGRHRPDDGDQLRAAGHAGGRHDPAVSGRRPRPDYEDQAKGVSGTETRCADDRAVGAAADPERAAVGPDVPRAAPRCGQVGRHARPQDLSRQDARRHLGDGAVPAQRLGPDALRPADACRRSGR